MKRSYLICILTFCLWGSVYVFSKYAMAPFSPMAVMFIRNLIAALFSVILLGDKITPELVIGGLLIALGVLIGLGFPGYLKQLKKQSTLP